MMQRNRLFLLLALVAAIAACKDAEAPKRNVREPEFVRVKHVLIKAKGGRQENPEAFAQEILGRAQAGEDFDALMTEFSEDPGGGTYGMSNHGSAPRPGDQPRKGMVKSFGDVSFGLEVGAIGMCVYDPQDSAHGWHIIKRIE
ncbi:MAG: peptidylprolyl isomerase [Planctomycetes bacterium]|nr:peptidylprolyl isomerase [Planctomycetota bacterium]